MSDSGGTIPAAPKRATQTSFASAVDKFLKQGIPPFAEEFRFHQDSQVNDPVQTRADYQDSLLNVPKNRTGTTSKWSAQYINNYRLQDDPREWEEDGGYAKLLSGLRSCEVDWTWPPVPREHPCRYPRTEDDVVAAVFDQYLQPVLDIFSHQEVLSSALTKKRSGLGIMALQLHTELIGESYSKSTGTNLPGIRVDKIFILSATVMRPEDASATIPMTRSNKKVVTKANAAPQTLPAGMVAKSVNKYLPHNKLWMLGDLQELSKVEIEKSQKGLLPVEIKPFGSLNRDHLVILAECKVSLGTRTVEALKSQLRKSVSKIPPNAELHKYLGTLSILQQSMRYHYHYGAPAVIVTDFQSVVRLKCEKISDVIADSQLPEDKRPQREVKWSFIRREDARRAIAATLWAALTDVNCTIDDLTKPQKP